MCAQELYGRFRKRIEELANSSQPEGVWLAELRDVLRQFDAEAAAVDPKSAKSLRDELCQQFELEALSSTRGRRYDVLVVVLKHLELGLQ